MDSGPQEQHSPLQAGERGGTGVPPSPGQRREEVGPLLVCPGLGRGGGGAGGRSPPDQELPRILSM